MLAAEKRSKPTKATDGGSQNQMLLPVIRDFLLGEVSPKEKHHQLFPVVQRLNCPVCKGFPALSLWLPPIPRLTVRTAFKAAPRLRPSGKVALSGGTPNRF